MKRHAFFIAVILLLMPFATFAQETTIEETEVIYPQTGGQVEEVEIQVDRRFQVAPSYYSQNREGKFRVGLVGPGIYYGTKGIDLMMNIGAEGEYFIFEQFSVGLRAQVATDFKSDGKPNAITSFVPQARYVFDFDNYPRWAIYVQAGIGIALIDANKIAADIALPGGGFWWQWNEDWSIGADMSMHILARSNTAISIQFGPILRYQF